MLTMSRVGAQPGTPGSVTSGGSWAERFVLATPVVQGPAAGVLAAEAAPATNGAGHLPSGLTQVCCLKNNKLENPKMTVSTMIISRGHTLNPKYVLPRVKGLLHRYNSSLCRTV